MITTLTLAFLLAQDPKPAAKTVEDRVKELTERVEALDKKATALTAENHDLFLKVEDAKARREALIRQWGSAWVKRYGPAVELTPQQSAELEELWITWTRQDLEKPSDVPQWKSREDLVRIKLTADQATRLARKAREDQDQNAKTMVTSLAQISKIPAEKIPALEKVLLPRLKTEEGLLLPQAHPEKVVSWPQVLGIVEANLTELSASLSESELGSLRKMLQTLNPKPR